MGERSAARCGQRSFVAAGLLGVGLVAQRLGALAGSGGSLFDRGLTSKYGLTRQLPSGEWLFESNTVSSDILYQ